MYVLLLTMFLNTYQPSGINDFVTAPITYDEKSLFTKEECDQTLELVMYYTQKEWSGLTTLNNIKQISLECVSVTSSIKELKKGD